jgi:hypothetical protein
MSRLVKQPNAGISLKNLVHIVVWISEKHEKYLEKFTSIYYIKVSKHFVLAGARFILLRLLFLRCPSSTWTVIAVKNWPDWPFSSACMEVLALAAAVSAARVTARAMAYQQLYITAVLKTQLLQSCIQVTIVN